MNTRNMASSVIQREKAPEAQWGEWTTEKAVSDGYSANSWAYRAISLITKNISAIRWHVETMDGEKQEEHPVTKLLRKPNPQQSGQSFFELISAWQQLSGEAYVKIVSDSKGVAELWPISPDRIKPVPSTKNDLMIDGYAIRTEEGKTIVSPDYTLDNVFSFMFINPANPIRGIGPLQVAAKAVDVDIDQQNWNKSAMQNRGILDGVFTFDKDLDFNAYATIKAKIKEMFSGSKNARDIGVIGSNAKYQRLSLTPAEMDFINSRKFNREEIFIIFGVPPQLAGAQDSSTYNNFTTSMRIFWEVTLIPILDDLRDTLNHSLGAYLGEGLRINYDISKVPALKQDLKERAEIAKIYAGMGVPVEKINEMLSLGVPKYDGWDKAHNLKQATQTAEERTAKGANGLMLKKREEMEIRAESDKRDKLAKKSAKAILSALKIQRSRAFKALEDSEDIRGIIGNNSSELEEAIKQSYVDTSAAFSDSVIVDERALDSGLEVRKIKPELMQNILNILAIEDVILTELSLINQGTVNGILAAVLDGEEEGKSIADIQQSILDVGIFSPERALRIAQTVAGTAQSIGQVEGAKSIGATHKTWIDSGFEVREEHQQRNGEKVGINDRFSALFAGYQGPRYPLDQQAAPADRINCRCDMTFSIE